MSSQLLRVVKITVKNTLNKKFHTADYTDALSLKQILRKIPNVPWRHSFFHSISVPDDQAIIYKISLVKKG